jgi:Fe-S-cluster-containing dehydrogenase component
MLQGLASGAGAIAATSVASTAEARARHAVPENGLGLLYDGTLCIGCRACIPACKAANDMPAEHTELANGDYWDAPLDISGKTLTVIKAYRDGGGTHKDQVKEASRSPRSRACTASTRRACRCARCRR